MKNSSILLTLTKKYFLPLFLFSVMLLFLLTGIRSYYKSSEISFKTLYINNHPFKIEIADSESLRIKGLSGRKNLTQDRGMLFIFPTAGFYHFWMKEMNFPLDFIWINNNKVIDLTQNVPIPKNVSDSELPTYTSSTPADKILEVNSGIVAALNISVGDTVVLK